MLSARYSQLFERPPEAAWVIVEAGELTPSNALRKAFEAGPHGGGCSNLPARGQGSRCASSGRRRGAGVTIEPAALELLAEKLGGDRLATRGELEKLFLYVGGGAGRSPWLTSPRSSATQRKRKGRVIDAALLGDSEDAGDGARTHARRRAARRPGWAPRRSATCISCRACARRWTPAPPPPARPWTEARPPVPFARRRSAVEAEIKRWPLEALADARRRMSRGDPCDAAAAEPRDGGHFRIAPRHCPASTAPAPSRHVNERPPASPLAGEAVRGAD